MPAPPVRCHGDQRFWRAGRIMFELSREHVNMSFSRSATHWHSRSLLVLHKIDLNKARASLTWKEMERLPPYLSCSALVRSWNNPCIGQTWRVWTSLLKRLVNVVFRMLVSLAFSAGIWGDFVVKNWTGIIYLKNVLKLLKWSILGLRVQSENRSHKYYAKLGIFGNNAKVWDIHLLQIEDFFLCFLSTPCSSLQIKGGMFPEGNMLLKTFTCLLSWS